MFFFNFISAILIIKNYHNVHSITFSECSLCITEIIFSTGVYFTLLSQNYVREFKISKNYMYKVNNLSTHFFYLLFLTEMMYSYIIINYYFNNKIIGDDIYNYSIAITYFSSAIIIFKKALLLMC
jgi:hypothetical protein